ncbi:MAG: phosphatase PAP2 family protein [Candidatus Tumulicola sp.]
MRLASAAAAVMFFAGFFALGWSVTHHGEPAALVAWEHAMHGDSALIAWWLTWACYPYVLAPIAAVLLVIAWRVPAWRARSVFSVVVLLLCWQAADFAQHYFMRPRRLDWVVRHESAFSYPSSHAAIAVGFYALWAAMLYASGLPGRVRTLAAGGLVVFTIAICWSRLALGAHYATDLIGGALLALAIVSAAWVIVPVKVFAPSAARL